MLASGKLEQCERTSSSSPGTSSSSSGSTGSKLDCKEKITVLLSVEQQQLADSEAIEVTVDDGERQLEKPIKVSWSKTKSVWKYPLRYREQVPNRMVGWVVIWEG